jgi:hypothetical protein
VIAITHSTASATLSSVSSTKLRHFGAIATRHDKLARTFLAAIILLNSSTEDRPY